MGVVILLRVIISGNPPCGVVSGEGELSDFIGHLEIGEPVLHGELIAEAKAVVVKAEAHIHCNTVFPFELHQHLIAVIADLPLLPPYGLPGFIYDAMLRAFKGKALGKVHPANELVSKLGRLDNVLPVKGKGVGGTSVRINEELSLKPSVRTLEFFLNSPRRSICPACSQQRNT